MLALLASMMAARDKEWARSKMRRGYVTVGSAADIARVSRSTVYRWIKANTIESDAHGPSIFVKLSSLKRYLGAERCKEYGI